MNRDKYRNDLIKIRAHQKEKGYARVRQVDNLIKRANGNSRKNIQSNILKKIDANRLSPLNNSQNLGGKYNLRYIWPDEAESATENNEQIRKNKILKPIEKNSGEYELAIKDFLGAKVTKHFEKKNQMNETNRSKSTVIVKNRSNEEKIWQLKLREINEKEKALQKSLNELNVKQKQPLRSREIKKKVIKLPERNDIVKSLQQVNSLLRKVLENTKKNDI